MHFRTPYPLWEGAEDEQWIEDCRHYSGKEGERGPVTAPITKIFVGSGRIAQG